ncbi:uncharacterized protein [Eurosta solidaginis]|uniref:uncharacterized protein n=1 Tax=Eurosta solidaginis TaxID=178769 RepID=UPI0035313740
MCEKECEAILQSIFCFVCAKFSIKTSLVNTTPVLESLYTQYFDQPIIKCESWAPNKICQICYNHLQKWPTKEINQLPFGVPAIWYKSDVHNRSTCRVCLNYHIGDNQIKRRKRECIESLYVRLPRPHSHNIPAPPRRSQCQATLETASVNIPYKGDEIFIPSESTGLVRLITQRELDELMRKLALSKRQCEELPPFLKYGNHLALDVRTSGYRDRQAYIQQYFTVNGANSFTYCHDVAGLMNEMTINYNPPDWRIFVDSNKASLKAVLLYKDKSIPPVPLAYNTDKLETYNNLKVLLIMYSTSNSFVSMCRYESSSHYHGTATVWMSKEYVLYLFVGYAFYRRPIQ